MIKEWWPLTAGLSMRISLSGSRPMVTLLVHVVFGHHPAIEA
jgi:hypothetical protein